MAINPYSFKDQYKPEWQQVQSQIAGTYTGGTRFDPRPKPSSGSWEVPSFDSSQSGSVTPPIGRGSGSSGSLGDVLAELTEWMVDHVWPLKIARSCAESSKGLGWKVRLPFAMLGAFLSVGLLPGVDGGPATWPSGLVADLTGDYAMLVPLGLGALAGWAVPTIGALILLLVTYLVGLSLALAAIGCTIAAGYTVIAWIAGWPSLMRLGNG